MQINVDIVSISKFEVEVRYFVKIQFSRGRHFGKRQSHVSGMVRNV